MRVYQVDITVEAANLKFMTKTFQTRLAEFILGVQQAEPTVITSVVTKILDIGKVAEKLPSRSESVGIDRLWTSTRKYEVVLNEVGDVAPPTPVTPVDLVSLNMRLDAIDAANGVQSISLSNLGVTDVTILSRLDVIDAWIAAHPA